MKSTFQPRDLATAATETHAEAQLLDCLRAGFNIPTDVALAAWLGIDKSMISSVRAGTRKLGILQRLKILDHVGFLTTRTFIESLLPMQLADELVRFNQDIVGRQAQAAMERLEVEDENVRLLDAAKMAFSLSTDADLARVLEVGNTTISMVRSKKSALGVIPKLKLLERVTGEFELGQLLELLGSTSLLLGVVEQWSRTSKNS
ncbi:MAG: hypothetical protein IV101_10430 [Dechloromonas sp.]|uniref:hypothetical protein n=1 Tax=Dechloromonas sp. TaxID=1917218 RepID=UPI0027F3F0BE|nr:hypothetical protein [Dechloromonas sp.]MBT9521301.1 hypothetical protein [Dechloromonas sp.]